MYPLRFRLILFTVFLLLAASAPVCFAGFTDISAGYVSKIYRNDGNVFNTAPC